MAFVLTRVWMCPTKMETKYRVSVVCFLEFNQMQPLLLAVAKRELPSIQLANFLLISSPMISQASR